MDAMFELGLSGVNRGRVSIACRTIEDLEGQLDAAFRSKCLPNRAEHISVACEFHYQATFTLSANNHDPSQDPVMQLQTDGATRRVTAAEVIETQPPDDPVLQKAIARHIVSRITAVDGTSWIAREVGRASQSWTFTYICKESMQAWIRATAKAPGKHSIGEWSGPGGLDSVNAVRPAFDCRGTLSIAFSKASRAIIVKYEHSPLHRTVSQLIDQLAPALIPPVSAKAAAAAASVNKSPKAKRNPPVDGVESLRKQKKRAVPEGGDGAEPTPKKKKPRKSRANPAEVPPDEPITSTEAPSQAIDVGPAKTTAISPSVTTFTPLNVPPAEAERRRDAAVRLLSGRGIDPSTLSTEQLNIFANQAPSLQETSLEMFAMYGAERLRIVHPNDATENASASPAPAAAAAGAAAAPNPANDIDPSLSWAQPVADDSNSTKVSIGAGAVVAVEGNGVVGTTESTLKPAGIKTTRGACVNCKRRKAKCTKERPECSNCVLTLGEQCLYAPARPRRKSEKTPAEVVSDREEADTAMEPNGLNEQSRAKSPSTRSFNNVNSAAEVQQQADRLAFSQQHGPLQYTTALDAVKQALSQPAQLNTPPTSSPKSRRRQPSATSIPVTQAPAPTSKSPDHRQSLPSGLGARQMNNQTPIIHAVPPTRTLAVQNSPAVTPSPTMLGQQNPTPRSERPAITSVNPSPPVPQKRSGYSQPAVARQPAATIGGSQYQTSPNTMPAQPAGNRTPAGSTHRASPQTAYVTTTTSQTVVKQAYQNTTDAIANSTQSDYQRYDNARADTYTSSWKPQGPSSAAHDIATYSTQQKTAKKTPTGVSLPSRTTAQSDSYSKRPSSYSAASTAPVISDRVRNSSQTTSGQWQPHQPQTSQATSYNYSMPSSQTTTPYGIDNMMPDSGSAASNAYGSTQPIYGSYGTEQLNSANDSQTQQNWYGNLPGNSRASTYGTTSGNNNALPTYQTDDSRSSNVSGYSGHVYGQASDQNIYDMFQSNRQH